MHIKDLDLNLLRLFNEVYRAGSVSRAAERLGLTQPAVSQGLTRLRLLIKDPLFVRAPGGVKPTPKAVALAEAVQGALATLAHALSESSGFEPASSRRLFRLHMSDIGESRFLPDHMGRLQHEAPGVRVATRPVPHGGLTDALDSGVIDFAFGFLPQVSDTRHAELLHDRYVVLLRSGHPMHARLQRLRGAGIVAPVLLLSANPAAARDLPGADLVAHILQKPLLRADLYRRLQDLAPPPAAADHGIDLLRDQHGTQLRPYTRTYFPRANQGSYDRGNFSDQRHRNHCR